MKVYKYRGDKALFERDVKSLVNNQIYAAPFTTFNDPFKGIYNDEITQLVNFLASKFKIDVSWYDYLYDDLYRVRWRKSKTPS